VTTTSSDSRILQDETLHAAIAGYCSQRASDVDACELSLREGLAHLANLGLVHTGVLGRDDAASFERFCEVVATVAMEDMSQAFSLWAHRMAIEYLEQADDGCALRGTALPLLSQVATLGSTSFASATWNYLSETPLPLTYRETADGIVVNGRIPWASNLEAPFLSVAAAAHADDPTRRLVFAYTHETPGLELPPYPNLLALQSTNSTSPLFVDAAIPREQVLTGDFPAFVQRVLATFLLIQSSFCWGLARRSLAEAATQVTGGQREILREDLEALEERAAVAEASLRRLARVPDRSSIDNTEVLQLRLDWGRLAVEAVALEAKLAGGRGYMLHSGTARRLRESAFLPVQAPTEIQLRWLLSRSA